ncbi:hypothetical protein KKE85_01100 [Patescibacteria group bacterium]|nr:hypothetical protein [Patescibacteria group bacterium]
MYMYAMRGRIVSVYGENPYLRPAADFSEDSFFGYICEIWAGLTQNYGALWTIFSSLITKLGQKSVDLTFSLYKTLALIGNSIVLVLLYLITKLKSFDELKTKKILFLYAWSPVFLIEFINNAHNDVWMIVFGLLALYLYYKKKDLMVIPCLVLAGLVKYVYWILIPIFLIFFLREKRLNVKKFFYSFLISLVLLIAICLPFFYSFRSLQGLIWQAGMNLEASHLFSPFLLGVLSLGNLIGFSSISLFFSIILSAGRLLFAFAYLVNLFLKQNIVKAISICLMLFVLLVPSTAFPWYATWFLPFLILGLNVRGVAFWTCAIMVAYPLLYSFGISVLILAMPFWIFFVFKWIKKQRLFSLIN